MEEAEENLKKQGGFPLVTGTDGSDEQSNTETEFEEEL